LSADTERIAQRIREAAATVHAPARLHERVAEERRRRAPARRRTLLAAGGALAGAVAAGAAALVLVLGGGASGPTIDEAVALALRPAAAGAPAVDPGDPGHLELGVGGVEFPNYRGWHPVGARTDDIDGRRAVTVSYRSDDSGPVSYTIVDGAPLKMPDGVKWRDYRGYHVALLRNDGERVVAWEQGGHTCIVAGRGSDVTALLRAGTHA
jgi:hypothetical protein